MPADYLNEPDQLTDIDLPFMHTSLLGHKKPFDHIISSAQQRNNHHAYLLTGPRGIGKATLAHKCARTFLRQPLDAPQSAVEDIPDDETFSMINAGAHPNFFGLCRAINPKTKKFNQAILVDQVRALASWLQATAGMRGYRTVVVDPLEALNISAANALLKMLEEPPKHTLFFLISHAPGQLLPTLKSRCIQFALNPLQRDDVRQIIQQRLETPQLDEAEMALTLTKSDGNARFALALAGAHQDGTLLELIDYLSQLPAGTKAQSYQLAARLASNTQKSHFTTFFEIISHHLAVTARAGEGATAVADMWQQNLMAYRDTQTYNLDRKQFFAQAIDWCQKAAKQTA